MQNKYKQVHLAIAEVMCVEPSTIGPDEMLEFDSLEALELKHILAQQGLKFEDFVPAKATPRRLAEKAVRI